MKKICIWQMKGGVGKTTISFNLASELAFRDNKVLCVDLDIQSNLTSFFDKDLKGIKGDRKKDINSILSNEISAIKGIYKSKTKDSNGNRTLSFIKGSNEIITPHNTFYSLDSCLSTINSLYDYCVIDCHPDNSDVSLGALYTSDLVLLPIVLDGFSRDNLNLVIKEMSRLENISGKELNYKVVVNRLRNLRSQTEIYKDLVLKHDYPILDTAISESAYVSSALLTHKPLYKHRKNAPITRDFKDLTEEVLGVL